MREPRYKLLKKDLFGEVSLGEDGGFLFVLRDAGQAPSWIRWLANWLLRREARALAAAGGSKGIPEVLRIEKNSLCRSWIAGEAMHRRRPTNVAYFRAAAKILRRLHSNGVVHNDLAKEPNWLVTEEGFPAIVDFQLAWYSAKRGRLFRLLAHEDLRHLLKHKRTYCPQHLTRRELAILENPTLLSRMWMSGGKPVYLFITRKLLGWADREGADDRSAYR